MTEPPSCVGDYLKRAPECDGDVAEPRPCTWRGKCYGWQLECKTLGLDPYTEAERLKAEDGPAAFEARCRELADKWGPPPATARRAPRRRGAPAEPPAPEGSPRRLLELFAWHLVDLVRAALGPELCPTEAAVLVGQAYVAPLDRGALELLVRTGPASSVPVLRLTPAPAAQGLEAALPLEGPVADKLAAAVGAVRARPLSRGRLGSSLLIRRSCWAKPLVGAVLVAVEAARG